MAFAKGIVTAGEAGAGAVSVSEGARRERRRGPAGGAPARPGRAGRIGAADDGRRRARVAPPRAPPTLQQQRRERASGRARVRRRRPDERGRSAARTRARARATRGCGARRGEARRRADAWPGRRWSRDTRSTAQRNVFVSSRPFSTHFCPARLLGLPARPGSRQARPAAQSCASRRRQRLLSFVERCARPRPWWRPAPLSAPLRAAALSRPARARTRGAPRPRWRRPRRRRRRRRR